METPALLGGTPVRSTLPPYARQTIDDAAVAAVAAAVRGEWITQGPTVARFEEALAACGEQHDVVRALDKVCAHYATR